MLLILIFAFVIVFNNGYAEIRVFDKETGKYIYDPDITLNPKVQLVGQPGTGGTGPFLYKPVIPLPIMVTVTAEGYKSEKKLLILNKWKPCVIYLEKDVFYPIRKGGEDNLTVLLGKNVLTFVILK